MPIHNNRPVGLQTPTRESLTQLKPIRSSRALAPMQMAGGAHDKLTDPPKLSRPVVMLPGLTLRADSFNPMAEHFAKTNGQPAVYEASTGQFHAGTLSGRVLSDQELKANKTLMFELEPRNRFGAPSDKQKDVAELMKAVARATGQSTVDVVTHSAGGHDLRTYLDNRVDQGVKLNNVVMIGPVSHGTIMGTMGAVVGMGHMPLLAKASEEMRIGSEYTDKLNGRFDVQRDQMNKLTVIATDGAPTVGPGGLRGGDGDGFVEPEQAALPGAKNLLLSSKAGASWGRRALDATPINHLQQVGFTGVINFVGEALTQ